MSAALSTATTSQTSPADARAAITLKQVTKYFKKTTLRREYTTLKSELVRIISGKRKVFEPAMHIQALKGVDATIPKGATVGIIGRNGSGKSTLLKIITGIYRPTGGEVKVNGRISALLELGAGFHPDFTGRENIFINGIILGMSRAELKERVNDIIAFAELGEFIDEPVRTYSSGMFMRLAFAVATHVDPDILIIDEILSVGDEHFARKSMARMNEFKASGRTIVLVTHSLGTVEEWCDLALWVDGGVARMLGPPKEVVAAYRRAVEQAEVTHDAALNAPGVALPALAPPAPVPAPTPPTQVRLQGVRLLDGGGAPTMSFGPDSAVEVCLDYEMLERAECQFRVELKGHGNLLFASTLTTGAQEPGKGTARLRLDRIGLGDGAYELCASATTSAQALQTLTVTLQVASPGGADGLIRPSHAWQVEPVTAQKPSLPQ